MQDTTSERLKMKWSATLLAVYAQHEITTMTTISMVHRGCRLESEEKMEKMGTMMNCAHYGKGWVNQGASGGR